MRDSKRGDADDSRPPTALGRAVSDRTADRRPARLDRFHPLPPQSRRRFRGRDRREANAKLEAATIAAGAKSAAESFVATPRRRPPSCGSGPRPPSSGPRRSAAAAEDRATEVRREAEQRASDVRREAESEAQSIRDDLREQRLEMERREHRLTEREERLDEQHRAIEERQTGLTAQLAELDRRKAEIRDLEDERRRILEGVANLTTEQAKTELVAAIEAEAKRHAHSIVRDIERQAQDEGETQGPQDHHRRGAAAGVGADQRVGRLAWCTCRVTT